jgi:hypothetical protein
MPVRLPRSRKLQKQPSAAEQRKGQDDRAMQQYRQQQREQDERQVFLKGSAQEHQQGNRQI